MHVHSQAYIFGSLTDEYNKALESAGVSVKGMSGGVVTDKEGRYEMKVMSDAPLTIVFSYVGSYHQEKQINLAGGQRLQLDVVMKSEIKIVPEIVIEDKADRLSPIIKIDPKISSALPSASGGIEAILKTLPGVVSNNELSSQYSVRGGNYDENLTYVNDIEIYRPFLIRSGQQEGLSFLNPDMVQSISFSAGGFDAKYGDKMSSVLDIKYRKPKEFAANAAISLLGASLLVEGASKNHRFTAMLGARQKSNQYLLGSLETQGEYNPSFTDIQTYLTFDVSEKFELNFLGNYSLNSYQLIPQSRETDFGTIQESYRLTIFFEGREVDRFDTQFGAFSAIYKPNANLNMKWIVSAFSTRESETFDILGYYSLGELERDLGSDSLGEVIFERGSGAFHEHARNYLNANVMNVEYKAYLHKNHSFWQWGVKYQHENISDEISEWTNVDSAGYSIPQYDDEDIDMFYSLFSLNQISSNRYMAYLQNSWSFSDNSLFQLTTGIRAQYFDFSNEILISPRGTFSFAPRWKTDIVFRFSSGIYYQPPFYRELRKLDGSVNYEIESQQSIHFVLGSDLNFKAWGRPFKLLTEAYYKQLNNLIPYEIDNVRIRYYGENMASGFAKGIDLKVNGEFVKGIESWASVSVMQTYEDVNDDFYYLYFNESGEQIISGYTYDQTAVDSLLAIPNLIPRPSDQRVTVSLLFQDYLPKLPSCQVHINLVFGSGLPFGPPDSIRYKDVLRYEPYRRVDMGFSYMLKKENQKLAEKNPFRFIKTAFLSLEVFNILAINNTVSKLWIKDIYGVIWGVPDYLSPRLINAKFIATF
jgi:hypothetical protein